MEQPGPSALLNSSLYFNGNNYPYWNAQMEFFFFFFFQMQEVSTMQWNMDGDPH